MTTNYFSINMKGNTKTAIPTTTSVKSTCPDTCPLKEKGCYAKYSFLGAYWNRLSNGDVKNSFDYTTLLDKIRNLPNGQLWRHNQAGDLPHVEGKIVKSKLYLLIEANKNKKGFTYTHHDINVSGSKKQYSIGMANRNIISYANNNGFTVNLSANNPEQADEYKALGIAPVVTLLPMDAPNVSFTDKGNKIVACPADKSKKITCKTCKLCSIADRDYIIGFRAHGTGRKSVGLIATDKA